eukprot:scpid62411/ scgid14536/ 
MEVEGAKLIFSRSRSHGLQYTAYIGDGDSKGYDAVTEAKPYGDTDIVKEECVAHVQKRLGKTLRDPKKDKLADGKTLRGRLSDTQIDTLQNYYGMAVRQGCAEGGDVKDIATKIYASLFHRASTDRKPQHQFRPAGPESFCGWQRMKAGAQASYTRRDPILAAVVDILKLIYLRLTNPELLKR